MALVTLPDCYYLCTSTVTLTFCPRECNKIIDFHCALPLFSTNFPLRLQKPVFIIVYHRKLEYSKLFISNYLVLVRAHYLKFEDHLLGAELTENATHLYYKDQLLRTVFYVYGSVHHNIFYEITNRCSYMQSILFHC